MRSSLSLSDCVHYNDNHNNKKKRKREEEKLGKREILYDVSYRRWQSARAGTNWWVNFRIDDTAVASLFLFLTKNQQFTEQEPCSWFIVLELRALKKKKAKQKKKKPNNNPSDEHMFSLCL